MRVGVIASMKNGLEHFIYRELLTFSAAGAKISLFPTKFNTGLYNAQPDWDLKRWSIFSVLLAQPLRFLRAPGLYWRTFREALSLGAVVDLFFAWYFSTSTANVDVLYATFGDRKLFIGYFLKQITGKPLTVTIHAYELYQNPNPALFQRALMACDRIITVTEYNREQLAERWNIPPERVEIVRISVNVEDYRPAEPFVILIVGSFAERKGHEILFRAVKQLNRDDIMVWVVGDKGVESNTVDVKKQAVELGLENQVAFFGKQSGTALKALYHTCDVFCLPCHFDSKGVAEGFPTVIAEAMAFGKPVISTRHVEIPRILDAVLVDENDVDGLADAIMQVYESNTLRNELGQANRVLAERTFSTRNARQTLTYLNALSSQPLPIENNVQTSFDQSSMTSESQAER